MSSPILDLSFPHAWAAEILASRPPILPSRNFAYPAQVEEVERGALEVLVRPAEGSAFLATCALGFRDPIVPTGVWSTPDPLSLCAVSGGYAYVIDTTAPEQFMMIGSASPQATGSCGLASAISLRVGSSESSVAACAASSAPTSALSAS